MTANYKHVLTVDDDPIIQQVYQAFFAKFGVEQVYAAMDGSEAIKVLTKTPEIDLIVSDIHMPETDGVEFLDHLQASGCDKAVVVVSSADDVTIESATLLAKIQGLNLIGSVKKPIKTNQFAELLGFELAA